MMNIREALGLAPKKKIRYGFVGLGDIAQEAMLPAAEHTGNSSIAALVTSDPVKAGRLAERYSVQHTYNYEQFPEMLASGNVDAVYIATPNWRHAEFVLPALAAGIHVLVEKPLEIDSARCQKILDAQRSSKAKLMVAYRLHFEPATVAAIERVRNGELGQVHLFTSAFAQMVDPANHRAKTEAAGPVLDMGPYPVNAVRNLFGAEPTEVSAFGSRHANSGLGDFDDTVAVMLRFPEGRLAQFVVSYYGNAIDSYTVLGTKGSLQVQPGYSYGKSLEHSLTIGEKKDNVSYKNTDHFGGEMKYFSDCILHDIDPEPDAEEGLADVRVLEAIERSLKTGEVQKLAPFTRSKRIDPDQVVRLGAVKPPEPVHASSPDR
ncbi:MAG TPA: Gfo/Idh/MocA family oxidoreductase [Acidobacteriaceae bacterium]|jgi:predicted dehydrogenase|nr:Gfo/Idh/MocA family oxidoreductase [Acidobacteriaceae bacterium]